MLAGLAVMFLAVGEVPRFARIAERHPQLTLIIDHMGLNSSSRPNRITENVPAAIDQAGKRVMAGEVDQFRLVLFALGDIADRE